MRVIVVFPGSLHGSVLEQEATIGSKSFQISSSADLLLIWEGQATFTSYNHQPS